MILSVVLALAAQPLRALPPTPVEPQVIRAIKPRIWMVTGAGGNVTVFAADHGLVLVDDKIAGDSNFTAL
ncbi:MAG TPA: hypothetical protein VGU01_06995, partial [Sphingomicrobium sp.]|nr:hypothetical protein [Sphingomicrobium sp.]